MTAREATCARKKRLRREQLERAYREWVCGGPLVDAFRPIVGGDAERHPVLLQIEMENRMRRVQEEALLLAVDFAKRCTLIALARREMLVQILELWAHLGAPGPIATHSTHPAVAPNTIPSL